MSVCLNICSFRSFIDCQIKYFCYNPLCTPKTECALPLPLLSSSTSPLPVAALHPITQLKEQKRESRLRYNPKDWAPVFERNRQRQQTRGRSLDPNHKFLFWPPSYATKLCYHVILPRGYQEATNMVLDTSFFSWAPASVWIFCSRIRYDRPTFYMGNEMRRKKIEKWHFF